MILWLIAYVKFHDSCSDASPFVFLFRLLKACQKGSNDGGTDEDGKHLDFRMADIACLWDMRLRIG